MRRRVPFAVVETATFLSGTANAITEVALPWLVLERTGNAAAAGLVAGLTALPLLVSSFLAGTVVDRFGRRRCSIVADVLSASSVAAIPLLDSAGSLNFALICVCAVLGAFFDPVGSTARDAMLPEVAAHGGIRLERANGINEAIWGFAFTVGPGFAGLLIALAGAVETLWATFTAFALSIVIMSLTPIPGAGAPDDEDDEESGGFWADTLAGVSFVRRDKLLLCIGLFNLLLVMTYLPIEGLLLPVHFQAMDEPGKLGLLLMLLSGGWVLGALAYGSFGHRFPRRATFVTAAIACTVVLIPLAFLPPYPVMLVLAFLSGFLYGPVGPVLSLAVQRRTPGRMRGRVIGVLGTADYVAGPVGLFLAGPLIEAVGLQPAFLLIALAVSAAGLSTLAMRPLRELDTLPDETPDETPVGAPGGAPDAGPGSAVTDLLGDPR